MIECPDCLERWDTPVDWCALCGYRFPLREREMPQENAAHFERAPEIPAVLLSEEESAGATADAASATPFVGREKEMAALRAALETRPASSVRLVRILGEPGIGKSRLLEECFARLSTAPARVPWDCESHGRHVVYHPVLHWVKELADQNCGEEAGGVESRLETLVTGNPLLDAGDAVYLQAAFGVSAAWTSLDGLPQENVRCNVQRLFALLLSSRRNEAGLVLTVDNAQWLDRPTSDLLNALLDGAAGALVVVLISDGSETHGDLPRKADLELSLGPLTEQERGLLFDSLTPALDHLPELRQWVISRSVGTPDFLEELARLVRRVMEENAGHITADHVANIVEVVPVSQEEIVRRRVERLDERTRQLLEVAAVLGPACSLGLLECFDQIRDGLEERLSFLAGVRFLERGAGAKSARWRFQSGHVREVVYNGMLADKRQLLHGEIAQAIERSAENQTADRFDLLAYHYEKAGDMDQAVAWKIRAADRQRALGLTGEALAGYQRVLDSMHSLDPSLPNRKRIARALIRQGELLRQTGDADGAVAALDSAQVLSREQGWEVLDFHARLESALLALWSGRSEDAAHALSSLKDQARELGLPPAECVVLSALGVLDWHGGRFEPALAAFRELAGRARALGLPQFEADALNNSGLIYWRWGYYAEAAKSFRAVCAIRMRIGDRFGLVAALLNLAIIQEQLGEIPPARKNYRQALQNARETHFLQGQALIEINLSNLDRRTGSILDALDHASRGLELARKARDVRAEAVALENLGLAEAARGNNEEGLCRLREALEAVRGAGDAEKELQIELDLLEVEMRRESAALSRETDKGSDSLETGKGSDVKTEGVFLDRAEALLARAEALFARVDAGHYRDLLPQACRLKGRALFPLGGEKHAEARRSLEAALEHARHARNVFDEKATLEDLLLLAAPDATPEQTALWRAQTARIEALIRGERSKGKERAGEERPGKTRKRTRNLDPSRRDRSAEEIADAPKKGDREGGREGGQKGAAKRPNMNSRG